MFPRGVGLAILRPVEHDPQDHVPAYARSRSALHAAPRPVLDKLTAASTWTLWLGFDQSPGTGTQVAQPGARRDERGAQALAHLGPRPRRRAAGAARGLGAVASAPPRPAAR